MSEEDRRRVMALGLPTALDNFLCKDCNHRARDHTVFTGPCAECWRLMIEICPRFMPKDEDMATLDALDL